jgi:RNA polymerase sigma-70 factor
LRADQHEGTEASPDLDALLGRLHRRGADAHPELHLTNTAFVEHLARCKAPLETVGDGVNAEDLFLSSSVLAGDDVAVDRFRTRVAPSLAVYLKPFDLSADTREEIQQTLWQQLLVGDPAQRPVLLAFSGRGHVEGFVGVTLQRIALHQLRDSAVEHRVLAKVGSLIRVQDDVELAIIKEQYRELFQQAVEEAVDALDDHERMILRLQVVDGLSVDHIARMYNVSQSTISRRLAKTRSRVLAECRTLLSQTLLLTNAEFDSLFNHLVSQLHLSVSRVFQVPSRRAAST